MLSISRAHLKKAEAVGKPLILFRPADILHDMKVVKRLPRIPPRNPNSHKGDFGKVLVVAGSVGMAGAAYLCCKGAYRAGAGLVYLCAPRSLYAAVGSKLTCTVIHPVSETPRGRISAGAAKEILRLASSCDSAAIGPGLSHDAGVSSLVKSLIKGLRIPMAIDADGLNAIASSPAMLKRARSPVVITPHPGELARMIKRPVEAIQGKREEVAAESASQFCATTVLKGHRTVVTDGVRVFVNGTGNPGMATGGSGDILTGMIAAFLAQGFSPFESAQLGVHIHGCAGDLARRKYGEISMIATDILEMLPEAFKRFS